MKGSLRSGWRQVPKLDSPAEQDRTRCESRLIDAIGAPILAIAPLSSAVKASDSNHPRTETNNKKGLV
jgi:hypothetical protein